MNRLTHIVVTIVMLAGTTMILRLVLAAVYLAGELDTVRRTHEARD